MIATPPAGDNRGPIKGSATATVSRLVSLIVDSSELFRGRQIPCGREIAPSGAGTCRLCILQTKAWSGFPGAGNREPDKPEQRSSIAEQGSTGSASPDLAAYQ